MKQVIFSKQFKKQFKKQTQKVQRQFDSKFELWLENPSDPTLNVHHLRGKLNRFCSINVTGDIRALYEVQGNTVYVFAMIGSHSQLYK